MKDSRKNNDGEKYDWLNELKRIPRYKPDENFRKDLYARIEEYERSKSVATPEKIKISLWDHFIELLKNKYILIGAGLAVSIFLIYILIPGSDKKIPENEIIKQFSKNIKPVPSPFVNLNIDIQQKKDPLNIKGESKNKIMTLAELHGGLMNDQLKIIRDTLIAKAAIETEIFRKKFDKLKSDWLEEIQKNVK